MMEKESGIKIFELSDLYDFDCDEDGYRTLEVDPEHTDDNNDTTFDISALSLDIKSNQDISAHDLKLEEKGPKRIGTPEAKSKADYLSLLGYRSHVVSTPILEVNYEASEDDSKILDSDLEMNGSNSGYDKEVFQRTPESEEVEGQIFGPNVLSLTLLEEYLEKKNNVREEAMKPFIVQPDYDVFANLPKILNENVNNYERTSVPMESNNYIFQETPKLKPNSENLSYLHWSMPSSADSSGFEAANSISSIFHELDEVQPEDTEVILRRLLKQKEKSSKN